MLAIFPHDELEVSSANHETVFGWLDRQWKRLDREMAGVEGPRRNGKPVAERAARRVAPISVQLGVPRSGRDKRETGPS